MNIFKAAPPSTSSTSSSEELRAAVKIVLRVLVCNLIQLPFTGCIHLLTPSMHLSPFPQRSSSQKMMLHLISLLNVDLHAREQVIYLCRWPAQFLVTVQYFPCLWFGPSPGLQMTA